MAPTCDTNVMLPILMNEQISISAFVSMVIDHGRFLFNFTLLADFIIDRKLETFTTVTDNVAQMEKE